MVENTSNALDVSRAPVESLTCSDDLLTPGMFVHNTPGSFFHRYTEVKLLGQGGFGKVVLCKHILKGDQYAVKIVPKVLVEQKTKMTSLLNEVAVLKQLDHPNIMKLYEFFEDSESCYLVGEAYSGGELFDKVSEQKKLDIYDSARTIKHILSGINYMHRNKIVHRDLKPENILFESNAPDALIKIVDFGMSTFFVPQSKMKEKLGTAYYVAPEVLAGSYSEKCDIWSSGVILYILITGRPPFGGLSKSEIMKRVKAGKYSMTPVIEACKNQKHGEILQNLIRHMLMCLPSMRYSAQQLAESPKQLLQLDSAINNMRQFRSFVLLTSTEIFAKTALLYMASILTSEGAKHLAATYEYLDTNSDGVLDRNELIAGYKKLLKFKKHAISTLDDEAIEKEIDELLASIDFDQNGYINYSEFLTASIDRSTLLSNKRLKGAFDIFDVDGSGKITCEELQEIFHLWGLGSQKCDKTIRSLDTNQDNEIDMNEFEQMLTKLAETDYPTNLYMD